MEKEERGKELAALRGSCASLCPPRAADSASPAWANPAPCRTCWALTPGTGVGWALPGWEELGAGAEMGFVNSSEGSGQAMPSLRLPGVGCGLGREVWGANSTNLCSC